MPDGPLVPRGGPVVIRPVAPIILILILILLLLSATTATVLADGPTGTLRGTVDIVGSTALRDGEVVVTLATGDEVVATGLFNASAPDYSVELPPGDYTAYATAPVHRASPRVAFTIVANATRWLNLTVVRIEEVIGHVNTTKGGPLAGASVSFSLNGSVAVTATTDADGAFRKTIEPGNYTVRALKAGYDEVTASVKVVRGEVARLDLVMEEAGGAGDDGGTSMLLMVVVASFLLAIGLSFGFVSSQARRIRHAMEAAEAARDKGAVCPECAADVPAGATKCVKCGFHFQVRCAECGRLADLKTAGGECPSCGAMLK